MGRMGLIRHERLMRPETNQKGGNGISAERTERGRDCVGNATDVTRCNHEIWATCPTCGTEYDRRVWGDTCPECARRTVERIRKGVMKMAEP